MLADGPAQARAGVRLSTRLGLHEGLEERRQFVGGDARPGILDFAKEAALAPLGAQGDPALFGKLHRVAQQVDQDLAQLAFVGARVAGHPIGVFADKLQPFSFGPQAEHIAQTLE